ncbi:MAG TPA: hypothetical protein VNH40_06540 [Gaiellaceae bacterium]|nr:hypothetical protein [Gaiellaceae bacterium]
MPNGKPGDDWYTDIVVHGLPTFSAEADRLVSQIAGPKGGPRYQPLVVLVDGLLAEVGVDVLAARSSTVGVVYRNLTPDELARLEAKLRTLRASLPPG